MHIRDSPHVHNFMKHTQFHPTYLLITIASFELQKYKKTYNIHVFMIYIGFHKIQETNTASPLSGMDFLFFSGLCTTNKMFLVPTWLQYFDIHH